MRIGRLRWVLRQSGVLGEAGGEPAPAELADALWLAALRRDARPAPPPAEDAPTGQDALRDSEDFSAAEEPLAEYQAKQAPPPPLPDPGPALAPGKPPPDSRVYATVPARGEPSPGVLVSAAAGPQLPEALSLARAMRPLRRRVPSATRYVLDEQGTAHLCAEQRVWMPALIPDSEPAFDLALVLDDSESMALWGEKFREFRLLCERIGAFRDVRLWRLGAAGEGSQARPVLRGLARSSGARDERELVDPSGRRLILVITDGVHPWWRPSGPLRPVLARWALASPLAIVQPFPQRMWARSPLRPVTEEFRPGWPGSGPTLLRAGNGHGAVRGSRETVAVPILELSPAAMRRWAGLISGASGATPLPAAVLPMGGTAAEEPAGSTQDGHGGGPGQADPVQLIREFRASVSPAAYQLAGYLSAVPLTLPVMRLVQESMMPQTGPAELAEVFLSGLLRKTADTRPLADPETTSYVFAAGIRNVLQSTLTKAEALSVLDKVGGYLVRGRRGGRPFPVLLQGSPADSDILAAAERFPASFGRISGMLLERIGGPYADAIRELARSAGAYDDLADTAPPRGGTDDEPASQAVPDEISADPVARPDQPGRLTGEGAAGASTGVLLGRDTYVAWPDVSLAVFGDYREPVASAIWDPAEYYEYLDLARFTGRRELIAQIDKFIAGASRGWVDIEGEAGVGKSALAAHLVSSNDWFYHFTWFPGARSPEGARKNLAAQLINGYGLDDFAPGGNLQPSAGDPVYLARVLRAAAATRDKVAPGRPIVLVIDTLAEIDSADLSDTPLEIPRAEGLPRKVFVIVTRRPGPPLLSVGRPLLHLRIKLDGDQDRDTGRQPSGANANDMRVYLMSLLGGPSPDHNLVRELRRHGMPPEVFADALVTRCAGVWVYLKYVLDEVRAGIRHPADVLSLPQGLRAYYLGQIRRQRERGDGIWNTVRLPALATLAALRHPVSQDELARFTGIGDAADLAILESWLDTDISAFLHMDWEGGAARYEIRHQSLRDLMAASDASGEDADDELSRELTRALRAAHAAITTYLIPHGGDWSTADQYVRSMLAEHAASAGRLDELVADPGFLLICQPSSVLLHRRDLKSMAGTRAVSAYEAALTEWAGLPPDPEERAWRLHIWARKTGAARLAEACRAIARRTPVIQAAMWTGTTHRAMHADDSQVQAIAVLPVHDERPLLASGGADGLVRLWDPDAAAPEGDPLVGFGGRVTAAAAVPTPYGPLLAAGAGDGTIWLWEPRDARPFAAPQPAHRGGVTAIAAVRLADDRTVLASVGRDGAIQVWNPVTRAREGDPIVTPSGWVTAAAAVPARTGQLLATGADDGTVRLWDLRTGEPVGGSVTDGHRSPVDAIAAVRLPDERTVIATGGADGVKIWTWDPQARQLIEDQVARQDGPVKAIAVARLASGTWFATAGRDRTIRLWDAGTGTAAAVSLPVRARRVNAIAAVPRPNAGILLVTGGSDGQIELQELYESAAGGPATAPSGGRSGHSGQVSALAVAELAGQPVVVSGSRDRTIRLWNPLTGDAVRDPLTGPAGPLRAIAVIPLADQRNLIAASDADGTVRVWDPATAPSVSWPLRQFTRVYALAAVPLPDRVLLATGGDGTVRLWDPVTGEPAGTLDGHGRHRVNAIASARLPDGRTLLASGGSDGSVRIWDPVLRVATGDPLVGRGGRIRALAMVRLPDGHALLAAVGDHGVVEVWDGTMRRALIVQPGRVPVNAMAAVELLGQTILATGGDDGVVRLWDPRTGEGPLFGELTGHQGPVRAIAALRLAGGHTALATGGDDTAILIWDFG